MDLKKIDLFFNFFENELNNNNKKKKNFEGTKKATKCKKKTLFSIFKIATCEAFLKKKLN